MRKKKYNSLQELYKDFTVLKQAIVAHLEPIFDKAGATKVLQWNILVRKFPNGRRCYFNHYQREEPVLGFSGGARLAKENPLLLAFFDETKKSVGKVIVSDVDAISKKGIESMIKFVASLE